MLECASLKGERQADEGTAGKSCVCVRKSMKCDYVQDAIATTRAKEAQACSPLALS